MLVVENFHQRQSARSLISACAVSLLTIPLVSCSSAPAGVEPPAINPSRAGSLAMEQYETNGDGVVSGEELEKAPELKAALARIDRNDDKRISADEIADRVKVWQEMGVGLTTFRFQVRINGSPLPGASVVFEPASFLGEEIQAATAITDEGGLAIASVPKEQRPSPNTPPGVALGLYKVRITKEIGGVEQIPAHYNRETVLAQEVAFDVPEIQANRVLYELSK